MGLSIATTRAKQLLMMKPYPYLNEEISSLNNSTLGTVLQLIGELKTGTKPTQLQRIQDGLRKPRIRHPMDRSTRIVSIDMGIRNLAFCILDVGSANVRKQKPELCLIEVDFIGN